ncbi:toll/interleukin-1 receptor domain-containing protein [Vibrio vulnificus]|uniref:toll/interleukin-1 receptor domain-containing protein n=1 Tax=Vibrio TaxID=662 RepID=UPI0032483AF3
MDFDIFLSHASEDKDDFVRTLSSTLKGFGVRVWYDEFSLKVGDSLSRSIDKGLISSNYGVVVLSKSFIAKDWTDYELRSLLAKELGKDKVILPIWHQISREEVLSFSPMLADRFALISKGNDVIDVATKIIEVVRPDLFEKIMRRAAHLHRQASAQTVQVDIKKINMGPPRHDELPFTLVSRVRLIRAALLEVCPHSMEYWIDGFRGDAHPTREVRIWEHIAACYIEYVSMTKLDQKQRKAVFSVLQAYSCQVKSDALEPLFLRLPADAKGVIENLWSYPIPLYDFEDKPFPLNYSASDEELEQLRGGDMEEFPYDIPDELVYELLGQKKLEED